MMNQFPNCIPCLPDQLLLTNLIRCQYITQVESGMEREVFICPFCGAPDREATTSDALKVTCKYCGAQVTVPRRLIGPTRRCKNHPEVLSIATCPVCGQGLCEQCFLAYRFGHALQLLEPVQAVSEFC